MRSKLILAAVAAAVLVAPAAAGGKRAIRIFNPVEKTARAEAVFVGKVSALEKDAVMLPQYPGDPNKVAHKVAVIKVEKGLLGSDKVKEFKVAFVAPPKPDPNVPVRPVRGGAFGPINFTEGQEGVYFLTKHPGGGDYLAVTPMTAPLDAKADNYKAQVEVVTKAAAALADPMKALKAEKPDDRFLAATALITKYRSFPETGEPTETVKVPADESKLVLKGLVEGDWSKYDENGVNGAQAFYQLGLTAKDGWVAPVVVNTPGAPPVDFNAVMKDAFAQWIAGAGKDYQINRVVVKTKK